MKRRPTFEESAKKYGILRKKIEEARRPTIEETLVEMKRREADAAESKRSKSAGRPFSIGSAGKDRVMICGGMRPGLAFIHVTLSIDGANLSMTSSEFKKEEAERLAIEVARRLKIEPEDFA